MNGRKTLPSEFISPSTGVDSHPWLRWYDPGVRTDRVVPHLALPEYLRQSAHRYPARPAIRFLGSSITYGVLDDAVDRFANALHELGVRQGDRVALLLPNCPQMVIAIYGTLRAGAVAVPTSPLSADSEMALLWERSGARVVVALSSLLPQVLAVRAHLPSVKHVVVANIKDYFPPLTRLLYTLFREERDGNRTKLPSDGRTHRFTKLLESASPFTPTVEVSPNDLALLQPTGGTTGVPKLAMLTHGNLVANAVQVQQWVKPVSRSDGSDIVFGAVPLFHIYGMTTVLNFSMVQGATMVLEPRFVLRDVLRDLARERSTFFPGVPTMYMAINAANGVKPSQLRSLKAAISGAGPLPGEVQEHFERLTGAHLVEGYGLTEASPVTHCNPLCGRRKPGSIGLPIPGTDALIVDQETGTLVLPPGEIGELAVRGPQVMAGYWQRTGETAEVLRDGWLFTGDLARMDEDGYFTVVDRKKDLIKTGGMNVFPREVEELLYRHPKVLKAAVAGIPDPRWGEAVKAYIVLKPGETATSQEIVDYCHGKMARYKVPKHVEFRTSLPENLVGKVLRRKLLEEEMPLESAAVDAHEPHAGGEQCDRAPLRDMSSRNDEREPLKEAAGSGRGH